MRLGEKVSSGKVEMPSTKPSGLVGWLGLLAIGILCFTNYLALYSDTFRTLLGVKSPMTAANVAESEKRSAGELAQIGLLLGVGAADAAANVKFRLFVV